MSDIPQAVLDAIENSDYAQLKHKWLWSFMPVNLEYPKDRRTTDVYLVGYCSQCTSTVSAMVPLGHFGDIKYAENDRIPLYGCRPK